MSRPKSSPNGRWLLALVAALVVTACAILPPVQEMSDARQAIRAAVEADARNVAPEALRQAEGHMDRATQNLDRRAYDEARREALAAKEQAIQARDLALAKSKSGSAAP